jgi:phosphatidylserine/phosphatidylglycerophosphate/cardiolipin synthase-like enzyme
MKKTTAALMASVLITTVANAEPKIDVHFSPHGGCTASIVGVINGAKRTIHVQAYSFTSKPIADALIAANRRGVNVVVVLDKSNVSGKGSQLNSLRNGGIKVFVDYKHAIAHDKVTIIDESIVETGSFNYTNAAENSNAENCLVISGNETLATLYERNWRTHMSHSNAQ